MAEKEDKKEKVVTPAQGAEGTTENQGTKETESTEAVETTETSDIVEEVVPEWAAKLLESNQAVIESNEKVIASIEKFKEGAVDLVEDIVKLHQEGNSDAIVSLPKTAKSSAKVKPKAKYVVSKGKKFADKDVPSFIYQEGYNVSKLASERLQSLLDQGIIEEAEK